MSKEILALYKKTPVNIKKIRELFKGGHIDPSIRDKTGETLLHYACMHGPPEIIEFLARQKTLDINARDALGRTALFNAIQSKNVEAIQYIQKRLDFNIDVRDNERTNAIQYAIKTNNLAAVKALLQSSEMLNHRDENGQTPLMYAVGHFNDVYKYIMSRDDLLINIRDNRGKSAIMHAIQAAVDLDNDSTVKAVAKHPNIDFLHVDEEYGLTPIEFAASFKAPELVKILKSAGAQFDFQTGLVEPQVFRKHHQLIKTAGHVLGLDMMVLTLYDRMQVTVSASGGSDYSAARMLSNLIKRQVQTLGGGGDQKVEAEKMKTTEAPDKKTTSEASQLKTAAKSQEKKRTAEEEAILQLWEQASVVSQRVVDYTKHDGSMPAEKLWELFNKGEYVVTTAGWPEHSWGLGFKKPYLVVANRGEGNETGETHFYEMNPEYFTKRSFVGLIHHLNRKGSGGPKGTMLQYLGYAIDSSAPVYSIPTKTQNFGTCAIDGLQVACTEPLFFFRKQEELMRNKSWMQQNHVPENNPFHPKICKAAGAFARSVYKGGSNNFRNFVVDDLVQTYQVAKHGLIKDETTEITAEVCASLLFGNIYFHHGQAKVETVPRNRDLKRQQEWDRVQRSLKVLLPPEDIVLANEILQTEPLDKSTLAILLGIPAYIHRFNESFELFNYLNKLPPKILGKVIHNMAVAGIDLNAKDNNGKTPLMHAIENRNIENRNDELLRALLIETNAYKLKLDVKDNLGHSALVYAIRARNIPLVDALLKAKMDVNEVDRFGKTPLMHAIETNIPRSEMILLLLRHNANINAQDKHGYTPLMFAAKRGFDYVIKHLLKAGADVNIENHYHQRAEDLVISPKLYELFISTEFIPKPKTDNLASEKPDQPRKVHKLPPIHDPKPKAEQPKTDQPKKEQPKAEQPKLPELNLKRLRPSQDQEKADQSKGPRKPSKGPSKPNHHKDSPRPSH